MEENKKFEELNVSSESIINLLLSDSNVKEFTDKVKKNDEYEICAPSYIYGEKFKAVVNGGFVTSFSLKMFRNKDINSANYGKDFLRYKVCLRIPTNEGCRYFESDYGVGWNTKELFSKLQAKIDCNHLPIDWLYQLRVDTKKRKKDGEIFVNADIVNIAALI